MLCVGGSAWAETFTGTVDFAAQNRITNNGNGTFTTAGNAGNQYALALADLSGVENINGATSVTLEFDVTIPSGSRWLVGIGDKNTRGTNANGSNKSNYDTDGLIMRFGTSDGTYYRFNGGTNNSNAFGVNAHCSFTLDVVNKTYSYSITNGETVLFSGSNVATTVTSATIVEAYSWLSNATISLSNVSYSFEYSAASFTYTVNAVDANNEVIKVIDTGTLEEPATIVYPYAINVNGSWYTTSADSYAVNVSAINPTANIIYTLDEQIVGFYEGEAAKGDNSAYSNGAFGTVAAQNKRDRGTAAGTLTPGKYQFIARLVADGNSGRAITLREGTNDPMVSAVANNTTKTVTEEFEVYATTGNLYINGANSGTEKTNLSTSFDYIVIKRIGDVTISKSISAAGYATLYTDKALDFSETGLTAYVAVENGDDVTFEEVTTIPANTGVLLKGEQGDYTIPVVASADAAESALVGVLVDTKVAAPIYVLLNGEQGVGFYKTTATFTVGANTAYLPGTVGGVRSFIGFRNEATGIKALTTIELDGQVYNMNGQRVAAPQKGLYIVNGKKTIIK